jgi:hypothetical protein
MTDEQKAAYVIAQAACLMAKVAGMQAENWLADGKKYAEKDFDNAVLESGCYHNAVIGLFHP